jgi:hypothetical protein
MLIAVAARANERQQGVLAQNRPAAPTSSPTQNTVTSKIQQHQQSHDNINLQ